MLDFGDGFDENHSPEVAPVKRNEFFTGQADITMRFGFFIGIEETLMERLSGPLLNGNSLT